MYECPNRFSKYMRFAVPAAKLYAAVWVAIWKLADHIALLERSIRLAVQNRSLAEWKASVENDEGDLQDSSLRGSTRADIRHLLDAANAMVEVLEGQLADLLMHSIDRDKVNAEYEKVLTQCKKIKSEREGLTYTQKWDFLHRLGATVLFSEQEYPGAELV